jgi:hypothetical protein
MEIFARIGGGDCDTPVEQYFLNLVEPHLARFRELVDPNRPRPPKS